MRCAGWSCSIASTRCSRRSRRCWCCARRSWCSCRGPRAPSWCAICALPWVGHSIAALHGVDFESFWAEHYAAATGCAKAALLARTGLQLTTPNPQNLLVELDRELLPTGRIVVRDIGDADCATDALECTNVAWTRLVAELKPEHRNTFWAFDEAGDHTIDPATLARWLAAHQRAYYATLARYFPAHARGAESLDAERALAHWSEALRTARYGVAS
jgi:hypothetical protein